MGCPICGTSPTTDIETICSSCQGQQEYEMEKRQIEELADKIAEDLATDEQGLCKCCDMDSGGDCDWCQRYYFLLNEITPIIEEHVNKNR